MTLTNSLVAAKVEFKQFVKLFSYNFAFYLPTKKILIWILFESNLKVNTADILYVEWLAVSEGLTVVHLLEADFASLNTKIKIAELLAF